jgi:SAM-dependent methyltransferase
MKIAPDILSYYEQNQEWRRHQRSPLEFILITHLIKKLLPQAPASILDLGAGAGFYSLALAEAGYSIVSVEPSSANVAHLKAQAQSLPESVQKKLSVHQADHLWLDDNTELFDGILLMGPLYHLFDDTERTRLLSTAFNRLKRGGILICTWLSRMGWLAHVFKNQPDLIAKDPSQVQQVLLEGEISHHPKNGVFRGKFDSLTSIQSLFSKAEVPLTELVAVDAVGGIFEDQFCTLTEKDRTAWAEAFLLAARIPESLGAAKTWLSSSRK